MLVLVTKCYPLLPTVTYKLLVVTYFYNFWLHTITCIQFLLQLPSVTHSYLMLLVVLTAITSDYQLLPIYNYLLLLVVVVT